MAENKITPEDMGTMGSLPFNQLYDALQNAKEVIAKTEARQDREITVKGVEALTHAMRETRECIMILKVNAFSMPTEKGLLDNLLSLSYRLDQLKDKL